MNEHTLLQICRQKFYRKKAFTLAEVLITLGIIGVIAAITIPILMHNYKKISTLAQIKEAYTVLNNALDKAKIEYGNDINQWYIPNDTEANASQYFAENYLLPNLKTISICGLSTSSSCLHDVNYLNTSANTYPISGHSYEYAFILANETIVGVRAQDLNGTTLSDVRIQIYFDVNGKNKPNVMGQDTFIVELGGAGWQPNLNKNKFMPYAWTLNYTRDDYLNTDITSCNKTTGSGAKCLALIMNDGWQIKDDYPID